MANISLRKANADRKLLDQSVQDTLVHMGNDRFALVGYYVKSKPAIGSYSVKEFEEMIKSNWQKFNDMLIRRNKLNAAVMAAYGGYLPKESSPQPNIESTLVCKVPKFSGFNKINKNEFEDLTIAQAIARKKYFGTELYNVIQNMELRIMKAFSKYESMSENLQNELFNQLNKQFGPESSQTSKQRIEYQESIKDQFELVLIDPLDIRNKIKDAIEFCKWYANEVDSVISRATELSEVYIED